MKAYRLTINLKLGLIVFAVLIAVVSLAYTNLLVNRLRARESTGMQIWAQANELLVKSPSNPHQDQLLGLKRFLDQTRNAAASPERRAEIEEFLEAVASI